MVGEAIGGTESVGVHVCACMHAFTATTLPPLPAHPPFCPYLHPDRPPPLPPRSRSAAFPPCALTSQPAYLPLPPPSSPTTSPSSLTSSPIHTPSRRQTRRPTTSARSPSSQPPRQSPRPPNAQHYWGGWAKARRESGAWVRAWIPGFRFAYGLGCVSAYGRSVQAYVQAYVWLQIYVRV